MFKAAARIVAGPFVERILVGAAHSMGELPRPDGAPRVHAMGPDPDRVLMLGAGIVSGIGVASHELGIGGHLARRLSALTGRGADVELVGAPELTVSGARRLLADVDLGRFDAVVVMLGSREAIGLRAASAWGRDIRGLLDQITASAPPALPVFMVAIAPLPRALPFGRILGPAVTRHIDRLNAVTREASSATAHYVRFGATHAPDFSGLSDASTYAGWANQIAVQMQPVLDAAVPVRGSMGTDEELRLASLHAMGLLDSPPTAELDALARTAKDLFGVMGAAVNLIDRDRQFMKSAAGIPRNDMPRSESFCSTTVDLGGALVLEDTRLDPRFSGFAAVQQGILFYAGYPVEAPNGQRIGTLCLFDDRPRIFTSADESLLRELALRVQAELWASPRVAVR
ncbi:MAG: hypothetical protein JWR04_951 [Rhodoglobus sp.]|nr:hypothetical protein [Rhodoglobus sp.]